MSEAQTALGRTSVRTPGANTGRWFGGLVVSAVLLIAGFVLAVNYAYASAPSTGRPVLLSDVINLANNHQVTAATFLREDARVTGTYCPTGPLENGSCAQALRPFYTDNLPSDLETPSLIQALQQNGASVQVDEQSLKGVVRFMMQFPLPLLFLANLGAVVVLGVLLIVRRRSPQ